MFYVDDRFASSDPVMRIPRAHRLAAIGLWTLAGTWSAAFLKDGFVPAHMVDEYDGNDIVQHLLEVKLWRRKGTGYLFNDWKKWQKTREQVEQYRATERTRKANDRARKAEKTGAVPPGSRPDSALSLSSSLTVTNTNNRDQSVGDTSTRGAAPDGIISSPGDEPVDNLAPNFERINNRLREISADAQPIAGMLVADYFLGRAKTPPRMATRYVLACIARHQNTVENYLHTGKWSE